MSLHKYAIAIHMLITENRTNIGFDLALGFRFLRNLTVTVTSVGKVSIASINWLTVVSSTSIACSSDDDIPIS